jgi:hypothetical protein
MLSIYLLGDKIIVFGVALRTVNRLEVGGEQHIAQKPHRHVSGEVWTKIVVALRCNGVDLLAGTDEHSASVPWRLPRAHRPLNW